MSILRPSKCYYSEILKLGSENQRNWKKSVGLEKIDEVSENVSDSVVASEIDLVSMSTMRIQESFMYSPRTQFFVGFLLKLMRHPKVFLRFSSQAYEKSPKKKVRVRLNQSVKFVKQILESDSDTESSVPSQEMIARSGTSRKGMVFANHFNFDKKKLEIPQTASSSGSSAMRTGVVVNNFRSIRRRLTLKPQDPEFIKIFKKISLEKVKISSEDFRNFLLTRYPALVADAMSKFFSFKYSTIDEYVNEMNRFVLLGEERHLNFCFEIFDFNKDKKITFEDTFKAMEVRTGNHYDEDLVLILEMFDLKSSGNLKNKQGRMHRHKSTFSMIKEEKKNKKEEEAAKKAEKKERKRKVSINYTEFCMIKFNIRPQILQDFLKFTCNYDILLEKGYVQQPVHSAKNSESIVLDMNMNPEDLEKTMKSDKYDYYCALDSAMSLFNQEDLDDHLKKFKFLQSEEKLRLKVITKQSMIEKLPAIFGYNHPYLSERFYECLSQGRDLTKAVFLSKIHSILSNPTSLTINRLAFELIDSHSDNKISVDEVCNIFESLPSRSIVYQEVHILVNMYIQSIFERVREKLTFIDFYWYLEIVNNSVLGLEFLDFLQTPFEQCFKRKTLYFEPLDSIAEDLDTRRLTSSSLQSLLD